MKKLLSIILVLMLALTLLTSCGNNEGQQPVSEGKEASGEGIFPAIAKEDIKVGVIHIGNPADGSGYSYAHDQGIVAMQKALGLSDSQIIRKNNVNDTDPTATEAAMLECIEEGANIIFGTSWGYMDTMEALAQEYPDVLFSHGSGYKSNDRNFNNYFGRIYQARYLTGIAAGLKTKTNKLGYVAAMGKDNSEVTGGLNAFAMGAYSVNPDAKVYVKVTNSSFILFSLPSTDTALTFTLSLSSSVINLVSKDNLTSACLILSRPSNSLSSLSGRADPVTKMSAKLVVS
jgi:basic membrane protein A